jgi:hypothetical protein
VLRLCTTHLESLGKRLSLRREQLELISQRMKEVEDGSTVIASLVGGDMNVIHETERTLQNRFELSRTNAAQSIQ